ncbi:Usp domain-containing protein [Heracleum sosnowskyi]|uniref:Usp domain-containing protein n=1 Tax=Heracleum sosnowskyi TaxID=360622 RepID=A0AAD8MX26_9APIA|nr:Usp domain-containing protein [Heracleum sosnowskyi]
MATSGSSFLRQLSEKEGWKTTSKRWGVNNNNKRYNVGEGQEGQYWKQQMEGLGSKNNVIYGNENGGEVVMKKRVMVVVDESCHSKHAMMWALTHVTNKGDSLTLLHIVPPHSSQSSSDSPYLASSLGSLCKACKPEVEVEALWIQGPKLATVMSQVKKLEVSVLVLGQKKPSSLFTCFCGRSSTERFVEECINNVECLTIGVTKQGQGIGGYLISTRWQKDFWLLA